ncbi:Heat shock protein [Armadillidium nasatum]|uniref:Heat shock protein n=1 Tax=Armadillidium nasatum TaxID=96803 RepID=A0A5N5SX15_9CRUS|nr:Heat shock protein [Armadillidium nasatum]
MVTHLIRHHMRKIFIQSFQGQTSCNNSLPFLPFIKGNSTRFYSSEFSASNLPEIKFEELKEKLEKNEILLIDVRSERELIENGYIHNSINIPLGGVGVSLLRPDAEFKELYGIEKPSPNKPIATMCLLGIRALTAQLALKGAGYTDVRLYRGSFNDWTLKGGPIEFKSSKA